jgi:hypothetical protein
MRRKTLVPRFLALGPARLTILAETLKSRGSEWTTIAKGLRKIHAATRRPKRSCPFAVRDGEGLPPIRMPPGAGS